MSVAQTTTDVSCTKHCLQSTESTIPICGTTAWCPTCGKARLSG